MAYKTNLGTSTVTFSDMMDNGFGIVTVMNAYVCDALSPKTLKGLTPYQIANATYTVGSVVPNGNTNNGDGVAKVRCRLDTLKIANVSQEGPSKTITGGQFSNPLVKFGKTARLEMQDALGRAEAIEALCGGFQEFYSEDNSLTGLHFGEDFQGPKLIIGDTFVIDKNTGQQVPVSIVFYQFLPDSIFNLTQDAEGDATVFDMNGDLLTTLIKVGTPDAGSMTHGVFYSIVDPNHNKLVYQTITLESAGNFEDTVVVINTNEDGSGQTYTITSPVILNVKIVSESDNEYNFTLEKGVNKYVEHMPSDENNYGINFLWRDNTVTISEENHSIPSDLKVLIGA